MKEDFWMLLNYLWRFAWCATLSESENLVAMLWGSLSSSDIYPCEGELGVFMPDSVDGAWAKWGWPSPWGCPIFYVSDSEYQYLCVSGRHCAKCFPSIHLIFSSFPHWGPPPLVTWRSWSSGSYVTSLRDRKPWSQDLNPGHSILRIWAPCCYSQRGHILRWHGRNICQRRMDK